ncbi:COX15/CtaA family protein [soil metagenome]
MTTPRRPHSFSFHLLSWVTLLVGASLIWVGAAVTTTDSGMAFSDWPLSSGSMNPPGWLSFQPQLLEHGHRIIATLVGLLTLTMFVWQWREYRQKSLEAAVLVGVFAAMVGASSKHVWWVAAVLGAACLIWLVWSLCCRNWPLLLKLTSSALILVVAQALLGGARVLKVSDPFGVAHGCLGQLFYCMLIAIALVSAKGWSGSECLIEGKKHRWMVILTTLLFTATSMQLLFGAIVRHTQRLALVATDVLTTSGHIIPPTDPFNAFSIFMHKSWALVVFTLAMSTAILTWRLFKNQGWLAWLPKLLVVMPVLQITLGVYVLLTARKFWVTNIHVLNGLLILAVAFVLMVTAWRSRPMSGLLAQSKRSEQDASA